MVEREPLPDGVIRFKTRKGEALWSSPRPDLVLARYSGHAEESLYQALSAELTAVLERVPKVQLFIDLEQLDSYDAGFRNGWTEWFRQNRARVGQSYILQKSALVKMGIQLVNLFVGELLTPLGEREEFEQHLQRATRA